jgi:hypothetical protein
MRFFPSFQFGTNLALFLALFLGCVGCGPSRVPLSDIQEAKNLAQRLLEKWKSGEDMSTSATESPPIFVSEDIWKKGAKLQSFAFLDDGKMFGSNVRFQITLKYVSKDGKASERTFYYLVTTTPALTFFREES